MAIRKVTYPLAVKLVLVITGIIVSALGITIVLVSAAVSKDVRINAEDLNFNVSRRAASETESLVNAVRFASAFVYNMPPQQPAARETAVRDFFRQNPEILAVSIPGFADYLNESAAAADYSAANKVSAFLKLRNSLLERVSAGETFLLNAAPVFLQPAAAFIFSRRDGKPVAVFFSTEKLFSSFDSGASRPVLVNFDGELLLCDDFERLKSGENILRSPEFLYMSQNSERHMQSLITDGGGRRVFVSFYKLTGMPAAVITGISYDAVFEAVRTAAYRNALICAAVVFASVILVLFFSRTITRPVQVLSEAAERIEKGEFLLDIRPETRDELGSLTESFVKMGRGLAERERLRHMFGRFINPEIAEKAMRGDISLGGEHKQVTVFFSDIRSFTSMSEKLTPEEVVLFLNEYMTLMVTCIKDTGGVVDKFMGDAIMAIWGAPVSSGSLKTDACNCVSCALMMRRSLFTLNKRRRTEGKPLIRIGCGINTGGVIVGQVGSNERMEYTVIGDAVNVASRTEDLNKVFATDILITEDTFKLVHGDFITEEMPPVRVKGKEKPLRIFAVIDSAVPASNREEFPILKTLEEARSLLEIPVSSPAGTNG